MVYPSELQQQWWNLFCGEFFHHSAAMKHENALATSENEILINNSIDSSSQSSDSMSHDPLQDASYVPDNQYCTSTPREEVEQRRTETPEETFSEIDNSSINLNQTENSQETTYILDLSRSRPSSEQFTNSLFFCPCETDACNRELQYCYGVEHVERNEFLHTIEQPVTIQESFPFRNTFNTSFIPTYKDALSSLEWNNNIINIVNQDENDSGVLDLSVPKIENPVNFKPKRQHKPRNNHLILEDVVSTEEGNSLPDDLPDLRFSEIRTVLSNVGTRSKTQKWIYSVRRRALKLSTVKKMFGIKENDAFDITLLYGGRGLKNPLRSNIPPFANHADREKKYRCIFCKKEFKNTKILSRHYTQHTTYRKYFCVVCWKGFYDSYDLRRHLEQHEEITVFYCELCETIFMQNVLKETHYKSIHSNIYQMEII